MSNLETIKYLLQRLQELKHIEEIDYPRIEELCYLIRHFIHQDIKSREKLT